MKVLLLSRYGAKGASSRVRFLQYLESFEQNGVYLDISPLLSDAYLEASYTIGSYAWSEVVRGYLRRVKILFLVSRYDLVVIEKEVFPYFPAGIERLFRIAGVRYVADYDDALFHRYDLHRSRLVRALLGRKIDTVMRLADLVVTGNEYLLDRALSAGANEVRLVPTVVNCERYFPMHSPSDCTDLIIGWIGTPNTSRYLRPLVSVFKQLSERYNVRFVAIGAKESDFPEGVVDVWRWSEDTEVSSVQRLDVGIMPLPDGPVQRGKCGYKLIQYMACGLPVVASPVGVNQKIVDEGENGFLAGTEYEWTVKLEELICMDASRRLAMGASGRKMVEEWYSVEVQAPRLLAGLFSIGDPSGRSFE